MSRGNPVWLPYFVGALLAAPNLLGRASPAPTKTEKMLDPERLEKLQNLQNESGYHFKDPQLLDCALTHKSLAYELGQPIPHNERLEFLGDAILEMVICSFLFQSFPDYADGELTKIKSIAVSKKNLASCAKELKLNQYLTLAQSEVLRGGENRDSVLADSFEALVAAIYLDGGFQAAEAFILKILSDKICQINQDKHKYDSKTLLQEEWQSRSQAHPIYKVISTKGPEHSKEFEVEVTLSGEVFGIGLGKSKKEAEQHAAAEALERLYKAISNQLSAISN